MAGIKKIKTQKKSGGVGRVLLVLLLAAALTAGGVVFGPRLVHHCDNCGKLFFGTGYYPNVIADTISEWTGRQEKILCADCAQKDHAIALTAGHSLSDFKRPLFEKKGQEEAEG